MRFEIVSKHVLKDKWLHIISYESIEAYVRQTKVVCASNGSVRPAPSAAGRAARNSTRFDMVTNLLFLVANSPSREWQILWPTSVPVTLKNKYSHTVTPLNTNLRGIVNKTFI